MAFDIKKIKMDPKPIAKAKGKSPGVALPPLKKSKIDPSKIKGL